MVIDTREIDTCERVLSDIEESHDIDFTHLADLLIWMIEAWSKNLNVSVKM